MVNISQRCVLNKGRTRKSMSIFPRVCVYISRIITPTSFPCLVCSRSARLRNLVVAVSFRFCIVRTTTYKLNHYQKSTTKEARHDFYFPEEMYQEERSISLYKSPPLCFPQKIATLVVLPLFSGQAWPFNINN